MNESLELSNDQTTLDSYSLIFDKENHNFSTSSEVSFDKNVLSLIDQNKTILKEESTNFNPFLLLFVQDEKLLNSDHIDPISMKTLLDIDFEISENVNTGQGSLPIKTATHYQLNRIERNSLKSRRTNRSSDEENDQEFDKFLQEHRTVKKEEEEKSPIQLKRRNRNSLKEFICNSPSSSEEEDPSEFYPKINRLIDKDLSWRQNDEETSDESDQSESEESVTFLESLSNYVPFEDKHTDAKQYFIRTGFKNKNKRQELAEKLFSLYDQDVFSSKLSDKVTTVWSARLTATAGHCTTRRTSQTATITLSHKVCDSPERCRDTLLHEMCHAAVSLIDGIMNEGHGPLWRKWTRKAEQCYPYLPAISVKHTYDIAYKFIYRCTKCQYEVQRHSKSLDIESNFCGKCMEKFELLVNNMKTNEVQTPKKTLTRYNLFIKEHFQSMKQSQPHLSTPQLMKHLSQEYKKTIQPPQNEIDLPDLEQLKI